MARITPRLVLFCCAVATALLALACGIGEDPKHQEPLSSMRVTGDRVVGREMTVELTYRQTYPVDVDVECDLLQNGEIIQKIGTGTIAGVPGARPDGTPTAGTITFPLTVDRAGDYRVQCLTPSDEENKLKTTITVAQQ